MRPTGIAIKYDGITAAGLDAQDERAAIYRRDHARCQACGHLVAVDSFELAHRIADSVAMRKKYGSAIIDHPLNRCVTHRGACNSAVLVTHNPVAREALVDRIFAEIDKEKES